MAIPIDLSADGIKRLRETLDKYTPGLGTLANFGMPWLNGALGVATTPDVLNNSPTAKRLQAAVDAAKAPQAQPAAPSVPALGGLGLFPPAPPQPNSMLEAARAYMSNPQATAPAAAAPQAPAPAPVHTTVPMPQARPAAADATPAPAPQPDMGFFRRNALMMRDPGTGSFIDPMGSAEAQATRGPDLIAKMTQYLNNKATG